MRRKIAFLLTYYSFWILFFVVGKVIFLAYAHTQTTQLSLADISKIFLYGLRLDASFAAYISLLPFLLYVFADHYQTFYVRFLRTYTWLVIALIVLVHTADLEIFRAWGSHLNSTPLLYLSSPSEVMASAGSSPLLLIFSIFVAWLMAVYWFFNKIVAPHERIYFSKNPHWLGKFLLLFATALLVIPLRGGLQQIPINQSVSYFSDNNFANQAAVNVAWNLMHSLTSQNHSQNPYNYFALADAQKTVADLYAKKSTEKSAKWLKNNRPNVLLIIWESATAKIIAPLGGKPDVTPQFNALCNEGILFTNFYASGDRSDKGLVSLLSGFPAQPTSSIIKTPHKTAKLPHLSRDFKANGYKTAFYYGGEPEFANMRSFLHNGGFEQIIGKNDFEAKDWNSKWGAHDHVVFNKMLQDINQRTENEQPFFYTLFTLSSHEPFEVPNQTAKATNEEGLFLNAHRYADQSIGEFIAAAKKQAWWQNTLVIIVADHGHRLPNESVNHVPEKFTIPMLWLGGALAANPQQITQYGNQTDLATTLLKQLNISPKIPYLWSKDMADSSAASFAFYAFSDGLGWANEQGKFSIDNTSKNVI